LAGDDDFLRGATAINHQVALLRFRFVVYYNPKIHRKFRTGARAVRQNQLIVSFKKNIGSCILMGKIPRNEIETQRTKRNEILRNATKYTKKRNETKYTKVRNAIERNGI
jgi:hypothetical protein